MEEGKCSETMFRDLLKTCRYTEVDEKSSDGKFILRVKQIERDENWSNWPLPPDKSVLHSRIPRGAAISLARALNASLANLQAGNIRRFTLSYKSKKRNPTYSSLFEDYSFPKDLLRIPGKWCYRNEKGHRTYMDWNAIFQDENITKGGFVLEYDRLRRKHYVLYTVPATWTPPDALRSENQASRGTGGVRTISLDPGVRTFLAGYDPYGEMHVFGDGAADRIWSLLLREDKLRAQLVSNPHKPGIRYKLWQVTRKRQNLCRELHWKCASFLVSRYDVILLPHFQIASMLRGKRISKRTKRLLQAFQFYQFKQRLTFQCRKHGKSLILVDEDYTSKTCGSCGELNIGLGGSKVFLCPTCGFSCDRDENGARNILLKQLPLMVAVGMLSRTDFIGF